MFPIYSSYLETDMELLSENGLIQSVNIISRVADSHQGTEVQIHSKGFFPSDAHCFLCSRTRKAHFLLCDMYFNSLICMTQSQLFFMIFEHVNCVTKMSCWKLRCSLDSTFKWREKFYREEWFEMILIHSASHSERSCIYGNWWITA